MLTRIVALSLLLASRALAQHQVLVVDDVPGPGVDFTNLQLAVNAAEPGDTVLVRDGTYGPFTVVDKPLTITPDAGALTVQSSTLTGGVSAPGVEVCIPFPFCLCRPSARAARR